ncbi:MAG: hypothetical protein ACRDRJ_03030 [Streptosporangiaceae bacterium]
MTPMLAGSATTGQATFEPDDEDEDDEPDELLDDSPLFPLEELEELDDSEPFLLAEESPDFDELSDPLRDLSFAPSAAGTEEPLRLSVR